MSDLAKRVQRLEDLEAIRTLVNRYAHLVWQDKPLEAVDLFAISGVVDMGPDGGRIKGRENLRAIYQKKVDEMVLHPFVHNHVIELNSELDGNSLAKTAIGVAYIDLRCVRDGQSLMGSGYYNDKYVREDGEWKFQERILKMEYLVPPTEGWQ